MSNTGSNITPNMPRTAEISHKEDSGVSLGDIELKDDHNEQVNEIMEWIVNEDIDEIIN